MPKRKPSLDTFGQMIIEKRGALGVRAAAKEIGISPATLSRVENGNLPDLQNFKLICEWLDIKPNEILGFESSVDTGPAVAAVQFKKQPDTTQATAASLGAMILHARRSLLAEDES